MRRCRMAVKIHRDEIRIPETQRGHWPTDNEHDSDYRDRSADKAQTRNNRAQRVEPARAPQIADDPRREKNDRAERKDGPVLRGREQRERIEDVRHGRKDVVEEWGLQACRSGCVKLREVYDGR